MTLEEMLRVHEGFVGHAYRDHLGYWTIGIGRLIDQRRGGGITEEEARYLLRNDLERIRGELHDRVGWLGSLSDVRRAAVLDMAFNLGVDGLLGFRRMLAALEARDYQRAADEALDSLWARQVGMRARDIAEMVRHDRWPERLTGAADMSEQASPTQEIPPDPEHWWRWRRRLAIASFVVAVAETVWLLTHPMDGPVVAWSYGLWGTIIAAYIGASTWFDVASKGR